MDLRNLIEMLVNDNFFTKIVNNPLAQFGVPGRSYLGATLLPEKKVESNIFKEEYIKYRTIIANAGTRYSPPQVKGNAIVGSMTVELAESDIAAEFTASDYDALVRILERLGNVNSLNQVPMEAMASLLKWADTGVNLPLVEFNEKMRWDALLTASCTIVGDNNFSETISYSNPSGHRVNAGGTWSSNAYDPYLDIVAGYTLLAGKGYQVRRMITSTPVLMILLNNTKIQQRLGFTSIVSGNVVGLPGMASLATLNNRLAQDGLPPIEVYDLQYRTQTTTGRFLPSTYFLMAATTGQDLQIDRGDAQPFILPDTLGYHAIGRPANRNSPGRAVIVSYEDGKGAAIRGEGWQTSLPVITNPEAVYVIGSIS